MLQKTNLNHVSVENTRLHTLMIVLIMTSGLKTGEGTPDHLAVVEEKDKAEYFRADHNGSAVWAQNRLHPLLTLGLWVRIPFKALMCMRLFCVGTGLATSDPLSKESYLLSMKRRTRSTKGLYSHRERVYFWESSAPLVHSIMGGMHTSRWHLSNRKTRLQEHQTNYWR
jgi:hypothetical protein